MPSTSTPDLVAAVSAAGALGSFGFAYTQPEAMQREAQLVRDRTDRPFNVNLFVSPQPAAVSAPAQRAALEAVAGYYRELDLPPPEPAHPARRPVCPFRPSACRRAASPFVIRSPSATEFVTKSLLLTNGARGRAVEAATVAYGVGRSARTASTSRGTSGPQNFS